MLTDKGQHHRKRFSGSWCANNHCSPERIDHVYPPFTITIFVPVPGGQVYRVFIGHQRLFLWKAFVFHIEPVFHQVDIDEFGYIVKTKVQDNKSGKRHHQINWNRHRQQKDASPVNNGPCNHLDDDGGYFQIAVLLCLGSNAGDGQKNHANYF